MKKKLSKLALKQETIRALLSSSLTAVAAGVDAGAVARVVSDISKQDVGCDSTQR